MTGPFPVWYEVRRVHDGELIGIMSARSPEMYEDLCDLISQFDEYTMTKLED